MYKRQLKRYEIPASKLVLELGYSVDYEDEKEDFEPDEADTVELINGERMPWEQVKRDGIDYIALYYVNEKGRPCLLYTSVAGAEVFRLPVQRTHVGAYRPEYYGTAAEKLWKRGL